MSMSETTDKNKGHNDMPAAEAAPSGENTFPPGRESSDFQTGYVATFTFAHAIHDTYSAFLAPLLPTLITNLSLSMTQAGVLDFARTILSIIQPLVGHAGDRANLRYLIILAPAMTGTMMSLLGVAPSYAVLLLLALAAGLGSAFLHALAPAVSGRYSGSKLGWGMGVWMAGGSVGFAIGPIIIVAVLDRLGLSATPWLLIGGWVASVILFARLRDVSTLSPTGQRRGSLREGFGALKPLMLPLVAIIAVWALQISARMTFLPTFLTGEGESLWFAGISLTVQTGVGWIGAMMGGAISDRWGRRLVVFISMSSAALLMLLFLFAGGWVRLVLLALMGFTGPATRAALMALVQENCPDNRAMANGMFLAISFVLESGAAVVMGALGDIFGLRRAFLLSALILLLGSPVVRLLPARMVSRAEPPG
jgi:FSR family fosmidomycin resistance protein-like MFS transporter